jgi:hypothetical protein
MTSWDETDWVDKPKATQKPKIILTSKLIYNGDLLEQIYDPKQKTSEYLRLVKEPQEPIIMDKVEDGDKIYLPIHDELLEKQAVILPSTATEYNTEEELREEIYYFIEAWVDISEEHRQQATWYIMLSWVVDKLHTIPYLRALGDYGTGKTRYLDVIGGLCYKPMFVGGSVRSAPIYRIIDLWRGTAIFDEFTLNKSDETEDIIQILNNGYQRGKAVLRCNTNNIEKLRAFDPFGAKVLASRKQFYDKALESRCITEIMKMTGRGDIPIDLTSQFYKKRQELQNKLLMYRFRNWNCINPDESITIDFGDILPRIKQSFFPFTVLFQHDREKLEWFIDYAKEFNREIIEENSTSLDGLIVNYYIQSKENCEPYITAKDIRNKIVNDGYSSEKLNSRTVGKHLKALGFESKPRKWESHTVRDVLINPDKLEMLKRRYVVDIPDSETGQVKLQ